MLNKQDPELRALAEDSVTYGREVGLDEDRLRIIRYVLFEKGQTVQSLKQAYLDKGLSGLTVEPTLTWLKEKGIIREVGKAFMLTDDFVHLVWQLKPELMA